MTLLLCPHEVTLLTLPAAPGQPLLSREAFLKHQPIAWSAAALGSRALDLSVDITICFWAWVSSTGSLAGSVRGRQNQPVSSASLVGRAAVSHAASPSWAQAWQGAGGSRQGPVGGWALNK